MSRFRANSSASPVDREVQGYVAVAERTIQQALGVCAREMRGGKYGHAHLARVRRDLEHALGALQSVRRVVPSYDAGDVDLQPPAPYEPPPAVEPVPTEGDEVVIEEVEEAAVAPSAGDGAPE